MGAVVMMTKEEAIKTLRELWRETNDTWYEEVYNMAIEALSADAISREEYEDIIKDYRKQYENMNNEIADLEAKLSADVEWIPITTSEPTTSDHVLVTYKWDEDDYETSELDYWVTKCAAEEGNKQCQMFIDHVIAWSFMPQPYREREKERNV